MTFLVCIFPVFLPSLIIIVLFVCHVSLLVQVRCLHTNVFSLFIPSPLLTHYLNILSSQLHQCTANERPTNQTTALPFAALSFIFSFVYRRIMFCSLLQYCLSVYFFLFHFINCFVYLYETTKYMTKNKIKMHYCITADR